MWPLSGKKVASKLLIYRERKKVGKFEIDTDER